jgi:hypothetical protein
MYIIKDTEAVWSPQIMGPCQVVKLVRSANAGSILCRTEMWLVVGNSRACSAEFSTCRLGCCSQGKLVACYPPTWLIFFSMPVDLTSWPKYYVLTFNSFFRIHNFIFQIFHYELVSLTKSALSHIVCNSSVGNTLDYGAGNQVQFPPTHFYFLKHYIYIGFGGHYGILFFLVFTLLFFLSSFINIRE